MTAERISDDPMIQARYEAMVAAGQSPRMAEMLALGAFPGVRTDATFNKGRCNGNQFEQSPWIGDRYREVAESMGCNTTGKFYMNQLAEFPGDPAAWVSGRGDVERVCLERGYSCDGAVNVKSQPRAKEEPGGYRVDPALIRREVDEIMAENAGARREDVEERVRDLREGRVQLNNEPRVDWERNPDTIEE